eukprot:CAMPEP_0170096102 /NCGR_PEP_ID=MMETSP0019_2-20121128/28370_1 /TAXON_ID=98059 /ORGANISM="Dinobryon sp., Strain UTEXLB2267" /LENGTH=47 /DNA_ID= /DNA_START= /DNA_END= /DNA_ORIENTATION=
MRPTPGATPIGMFPAMPTSKDPMLAAIAILANANDISADSVVAIWRN